ncbi:DUF6443 domain-containing protein [Niabella sp.]|uniref:DUF6443 domain-containing protein n=1 Tax=Niabella sp. TaxID=1962976 RepID=UPI0026073400|nr:DUF6443 domain-containing protein [Niabella sp.]
MKYFMKKYSEYILLLLIAVTVSGACLRAQPASLPQYNSTTPKNFVRTWTALAPLTDPNSLLSKGMFETSEITKYIDGLGRSLQEIKKKGSLPTPINLIDTADARDIVTPILFDELGREQYKYLPFASASGDGVFKNDPYGEQQVFMQAQFGAQGESNFYSKTVFEASPQNRITESFAPGKNWAGTAAEVSESNRRSINQKYWLNTAEDSVRIWVVTEPASIGNWATYATTQMYTAGQLYKNVIQDEHDKQVIEFKDEKDRIILKKIQLTSVEDTGLGKGHTGWLCTYYVYDMYDQLRLVIQPEGVNTLNTTNWQLTTSLQEEQCFRYEYDRRNLPIMKQIPGSSVVYSVYDSKARLVMSQDGNLRNQSMWNYSKYDSLSRPTATGVFSSSLAVVGHWQNAGLGVEYPTSPMLAGVQPLTETFYDDYTWMTQAPYLADLSGKIDGEYDATGVTSDLLAASNTAWPYAEQPAKDSRVKGLITGNRVKVLNTTSYTYSVTIYDDRKRPIQIKSLNHTGGVDVTTTQYSWKGQPLCVISRHNKAGAGATVVTTVAINTYDALGRLVKVGKKIKRDSGPMSAEKVIAINKYNILGHLTEKSIGPTNLDGSSALERQIYDYNIRGWLLGINREYVNDATPATSKYFGFDLAYEKVDNNNLGNMNSAIKGYTQAFYSGNISGITWRSRSNAAPIRRYNFAYDATGRIMKADYGQLIGGSFQIPAEINYSVKVGNGDDPLTAYDYNGNIKAMTQWGGHNNTQIKIDSLMYIYFPNSNKLKTVTEKAESTIALGLGDFNDGINDMSDDYAYDANGNLIMDLNKGVSSTTYNLLNLPEQIVVAGKGSISYLYDAAGNKLEKKIVEGGTTKTVQYLGNMIFEDNVLRFISDEEGRQRVLTATSFVYDYFLMDHLGNVRVMITDDVGLTDKVLEETHLYPFGLPMKGISIKNSMASLQNKEKTFQGQQLDDELGLNYYSFKYRNQDPQIGRFIQIDPLASEYVYNSTYAFSENDPVNFIDLEGAEKGIVPYKRNNVNFVQLYRPLISGIKRSDGKTFTQTAIKFSTPGVITYVINAQQYQRNGLSNPFSAGKNSSWTAQGYTISQGKVFVGNSSPLTFYFAISGGSVTFGKGDAPKKADFAVGGGIPVLINGLKYGGRNEYSKGAPAGLPEIGEPGAGNDKYLVQRSNAGYPKQDNAEVGKSIVAYNSKTGAFMLVVQQDGVQGLTLTQIRDYLVREGFNNAVSFDGSNSATLLRDGAIFAAPGDVKNNTIPSGVRFQVFTEEDNKSQ